ncbi:hypothetical protein PV08_06824 [Exophiala spinifera]|uniref:C2H2-type domain-containing protein n=1 Tax=Exophiala spinifera TaxID=91928 RepID=A0A0D2B584_9EURO|nr:uncharacterized protein PV08_06824 [Exophiala spinifera]KIW14043.1 hypothetical protein PV08_06824 [Exophiala spinifera]
MGRTSPQGLMASDFHHQSFVNPLDVFPTKSRLAGRQNYRSPLRGQVVSRSPARYAAEAHKFACCGEEEAPPAFRPLGAMNQVTHETTPDDGFGIPESSSSRNASLHNSPSPMDCEDCIDDCDDCLEEHQLYNHQADDQYVNNCQDCNDAQIDHKYNGRICNDTCDECDFSCFDCIDWNEFEQDKSLGLSFSVPLLGDNSLPVSEPAPQFDENELLNFQSPDFSSMQSEPMAPPLDVPMHHQCFGNTVPYWDSIAQAQLCSGAPGMAQQYPLPPFGMEFGCHPATAHQQLSLPDLASLSSTPAAFPPSPVTKPEPQPKPEPSETPLSKTSDLLSAVSAPPTSRACQWLMPCGTVCGASFASATDLKKHLKAVHLVKGVTKCAWQSCDSATFTSEAALTGHISKKHLAPMLAAAAAASSSASSSEKNSASRSSASTSASTASSVNAATGEGGPFKCTFPGCAKSFMYKQVRDDHVASCHQGNKMYCHICGQYLNGEGSNFKRHMATHRPKHQHMLCKFHGLGCKRRFPRLDNLRRHEACCKFGKGKKGLLANGGAAGAGAAVGVGVDDDGDKLKHHHHHHHHVHSAEV